MAKCGWCEKEMLDESVCGCSDNTQVVYPDGLALKSLPYDYESRCGDCGVAVGGNHHPGCDMEKCPRCAGQLISCGCLDT